jgi:hypothetical protein
MRLIPGVTFRRPAKQAPTLLEVAQTTQGTAASVTGATAPTGAETPKTGSAAPPAINPVSTQLAGQPVDSQPAKLSTKHHRLMLLVGLGFTVNEIKRLMRLGNKNQLARLRRECTRGLPYQTVPCAIVHWLKPKTIAAAADSPKTEVAERAKAVMAAVEIVATGRVVFTPRDLVSLSDFTAHYLIYQSGRPGSECGPLTDMMRQLNLEWPTHVVMVAARAKLLTPAVLIANAPAEPQLLPHT